MKRIHPNYLEQANSALLTGAENEHELKIAEGISYWHNIVFDAIGAVEASEMPLVGAMLRGIADKMYNQLSPSGLELAVELADIVYRRINVSKRVRSEVSGETPAEVMNNIHNNEVVLVDKALLQWYINSIKKELEETKESNGDIPKLILCMCAEAQKNLLKNLGLWEEQA